jgi:hypothetical protein
LVQALFKNLMDDGPAEFKIKEEMRIRKYEEFLKKFKAS